MSRTEVEETAAYRGRVFHFLDAGRPEWFDDGLLLVRDGRIAYCGPFAGAPLAADTRLVDLRGKWLMPGFIDAHVHYAQTDVIASPGTQLLGWLERYTFPAEQRFADPAHAAEVAEVFLDELLRNGVTSALAFPTVHETSVDALFAAARKRRMRIITGKVLMDRNCPEDLRDTAESGDAASRALIERWHGVDRLAYAVTPRFAASSSDEQLARAGDLYRAIPGLYVQSHLAENTEEVRWIETLFPQARSYLDVYDRFGLLGPRTVYAHCIHIDDADRARMAASGATAVFCPTSNLFLGSGLFDRASAVRHGVNVAIGTDVGAGTSFSMFATLIEGYKVCQLAGQAFSALDAFYLATLGAARALALDDRIGSFAHGREADFIVVDPAAIPLLERRMRLARDTEEQLFVLMTLGDDRAIEASYVLGRCMHVHAAEAPRHRG